MKYTRKNLEGSILKLFPEFKVFLENISLPKLCKLSAIECFKRKQRENNETRMIRYALEKIDSQNVLDFDNKDIK